MAIKFSLSLKRSATKEQTHVVDNGFVLNGTKGKAILLVHGMTGTPHEMRFIANYLNRAGFTIHCPRLANHGAPLDILKWTKWEAFYRTVKDEYLKMRGNYEHVYAGGLSMGALLALLLADEFKGEIKGVSCLSPTLFYDGWNSPWYRHLLPVAYFTPLKYFFYFKEEPPYGIKNEAIRRRIHEFFDRAELNNLNSVDQFGYPYFPVSLLYQLKRVVWYLSDRLKNIETPVQIMQAKDDDMTSIRNSQYIYDRVSSPKKELVLLENCYHIITADQERQTVALKMAEFFDQR